MEKCDLEKLISSNSDRITFEQCSGKSDVWPYFERVNVDGEYRCHVRCKACLCLLKFKTRDGTSGLAAHRKSCSARRRIASGQQAITSMPGVANTGSDRRKISQADKSELTDMIVDMCAKDIRPFCIVEGGGFRAVAGKLVALGSKYGKFDIEDALPSERTVSRHVDSVAGQSKKKLKDELAKQWRIAVTCDMWTHEATNSPYITVTTHYIDEHWQLCASVLATRAMEERKTAENIKLTVADILEEFGAGRQDNFYVTDNGANIKAAFNDQAWLSCCGHNINLAVSHTLQKKSTKAADDAVPGDNLDHLHEIQSLVTVCKDIVTRIKRTQVQHELQTTLKQAVSTRWNSSLFMMKSIMDNLSQLKTVTDRTLQKHLIDLNEEILAQTVQVLEHLDVATRLLSSDQKPTSFGDRSPRQSHEQPGCL